MGPTKYLNPKGKWKEISLDPQTYLKSGMEHFLSFEELTDYEFTETSGTAKPDASSKKKKKDKMKSDNAKAQQIDEENKTKKKKKKKKKKKTMVDKASEVPQDTKPIVCTKLSGTGDNTNKKVKKDMKLKGKRGKLVGINEVIDITHQEISSETEYASKSNEDTNKTEPKMQSPQDRKRRLKSHEASPKAKKQKVEKDKPKVLESSKTDSSKKPLPDMSAWKDLFVPEPVLRALAEQGFVTPMPIQTLVLPSACRDRKDIVGAAETGSGKTLAFGIPLLHHILRDKDYLASRLQLAAQQDDDGADEGDMENDDPELDGEDNEGLENSSEQESEVEDENESEDSDEHDNDSDDNDDSNNNDEDEDNEEQDDEEHDLPPSDNEEALSDIGEDEFGCVKALNNVSFDWLEEEQLSSPAGKSEAFKPLMDKALYALVLTPTRELAIQVCNHINNAAKYTGIKAAVVVGGMAPQKQRRVLKKGPEIVVATPGRLWELIQEDDPHLGKISDIRYLVIDEADRMIEKGHFAELQSLLELVNRDEEKKKKRQTYVFSATLTLVHTGPNRMMKKKKKKIKMTSEVKLDNLIDSVGIKPKPKIIDLTNKIGMAEKVVESRIHCKAEEKDLYLYYLLKQYPGRTLVFCNSKDCVRRLVSVFTLLQCSPLPLHADMHQRQRLKNLDKFRDNARSLLLATDVAARGLDIPGVEHVVHYQVPRTSENYIHRSGRTARGYNEGLSVVLVSPDELKSYRKILHTLNREDDLPMFPVEDQFIPRLKERVSLAKNIDTQEYRFNKKKVQNSWFEKAAKEMDMELDEDLLLNDLGDSQAQAEHKRKIASMRAELRSMLSQPVIPRFFSGKYPTMSGRLQVPYMKDLGAGGAVGKVRDSKKTQPKNIVNVIKKRVKNKTKKKSKKS